MAALTRACERRVESLLSKAAVRKRLIPSSAGRSRTTAISRVA